MKKLLRSRRGETLAETMCACCLLAIALTMVLGMMRFGVNSRRRANEMSKEAQQLRSDLSQAETVKRENVSIAFMPSSEEKGGEEVLFTVDTVLETKSVPTQEGKRVAVRWYTTEEVEP